MRNAGRRSFVRGHGGHRKSKQALLFASIGFVSALASGGAFAATTVQAESMSLSGGYAVDGTLIKIPTANSGTATTTFNGAAGTYNIDVFVELENDGRPDLKVYKGSTLLRDYTYPLGANGQAAGFTISNVPLAAGDVIRLVGTVNGGALARVDRIVFTQVTAVTTTPTSSTTPAATASAAGTAIPPAAQIVDANGAVWTIAGGKVMRNGVAAGYSANVVGLYWNGTSVFQTNSAGGWWSWNGVTWIDAANPTSSTTASTPATGTTSSTGTTSTTGTTATTGTTPTSTTGTTSTSTAPTTLGNPITYEAEAMSLAGYAVEGTLIKIASANSGTATQVFNGASGTYNIQVVVSLENDGTPNLKLYRGTALLRDYTYPSSTTNGATASFTVNNVSLVKGDTLRLVGTVQAGAMARVDKIVLTPVIVATTTPTDTSALTTSAAGTAVPPATQIVDTGKAVWNISAGKVMRNGVAAGFSANVVGLYWNGSTVFQTNSAGGWWSWNGTTWVDAANPTATASGGTTTPSTGTTGSTGSGSTGSTGSTAPNPPTSTSSLPSGGARAVTTFESIGLYWTPPASPGSTGCEIVYKKVGDTAWKKGLNMWYDTRNSECRGSIVMLTPNTEYEVQFAMPGKSPVAGLVAKTWSEQFPIAKTVQVQPGSSTLAITQGGSASGYVLYTPAPGTSGVIDVGNGSRNNITVSAPYVIIRGFTLRGAQQDAIDLLSGSHDVVIEDNDISGWGRYNYTNSSGWQIGVDEEAAVRCRMVLSVERTIVQRNKIHDPRYGANSWSWGHPAGPQGISYDTCGGNHVIRHNDFWSSAQHYFNDAIGGSDNFTDAGFPRADSDIYGNKIQNAWDDAIEAEGANPNVRIWGNYMNNTATGVATTVVNRGPVYVFRNVYNRSRQLSERTPDNDDRNTFAKSGTGDGFGDGRRYVFHNTLLQIQESGNTLPSGAGSGISGPPAMTNTVTRNNIFHIWKSWWSSVASNGGASNDVDYDLRNGNIDVSGGEAHGIVGTPIYQSGNGASNEDGGMYQLAPNSPGYDQGLVIPNFSDGFTGSGPDMGAHEAGTPAMKFGVSAGTREY